MLLTFGHGTATAERMTELLRGAGVAVLVDVRTAPGSRRHPHVARAELERWLPEAGVSYRWDKRLGGFRKAAPDSPDTAWREDMFRGYAAHMRMPAAARGRPDVDQHGHAGAPEQFRHPLGRSRPVPERQQHLSAILRRPAVTPLAPRFTGVFARSYPPGPGPRRCGYWLARRPRGR